MNVINIDPDLLQRDGEAANHAGEQGRVHVEGEYVDDIPNLLTTLVPADPYAYVILGQIDEQGRVKLPVETTREGIRGAYEVIHAHSRLLEFWSLTELRGSWYSFHEGIVRVLSKENGEITDGGETIALFPVNRTSTGITGELVWSHVPRQQLGTNRAGQKLEERQSFARRQVLLLQNEFFKALRASDVKGILSTLNDDAQAAVRDYVNDTGTLITLDGKDGHAWYYEALFDTYEIRSVDVLRRMCQDWFAFAEIRISAQVRGGADVGRTISFNTAEFFVPAADGKFIARVGHGTDVA